MSEKKEIYVEDFMIQNVVTLKPSDTIKTLLETLTEHRIGGVPIVDNNNHLIGFVSDGDVLRYLNPQVQTSYFFYYREELDEVIPGKKDTLIKDIMRKHVHAVEKDCTLEEALEILSRHHYKKLPVKDKENKLVGVISRGDLVKRITARVIELL